jgi:phospholipase/carboxylesterase
MYTRRQVLGAALGAAVLWPTSGYTRQNPTPRLSVRRRTPTRSIEPGLHELGLRAERDALIYIPETARDAGPVPTLLLLHGATGTARGIEARFPMASKAGIALLIPSSKGGTWDGIQGRYGADVAFISKSMDYALDRLAIDPARFGVAGFSDGASYALALGLTNGDLFSHIIAFSPGFIPRNEERGRPGIFIAHGTGDTILPIEGTSRRIVSLLTRRGYSVDYEEFDGPHTVVPAMAEKAFDWFTGTPRREPGR